MEISQLVFVPDPPNGVKLDTPLPPAAQGQCFNGSFDIDQCAPEVKPSDPPKAFKQGVTLSPNVTALVSLFSITIGSGKLFLK